MHFDILSLKHVEAHVGTLNQGIRMHRYVSSRNQLDLWPTDHFFNFRKPTG